MTKRLAVLVVALAVAASAWAMNARYSSGVNGLSITQTNLNTAFTDNHSGGSSSAFNARHVSVCSRAASADACFFDLGDGVATTADWRVEPGACVEVTYSAVSGGDGWAAVGAICPTGDTATWDVKGGR
jgi:hypothetical protein